MLKPPNGYDKYGTAVSTKIAVRDMLVDLEDELNAEIYKRIIEQIEPAIISEVMAYCRHNQSKATRILGISRVNFRKKLRKYGYFEDKNVLG